MLLGSAPAPVNAATTISGAVVVIPVRSSGYRLTQNKATYLASFGAGNSDALVTDSGGCAIKLGQVRCYGLAGTVGDGSNRNRPLPVPITMPGNAQAVKLAEAVVEGRLPYRYFNEGSFYYREMRQMCAQGAAGVYCWGNNAGQAILSPTTVYTGTTRMFEGNVLQDAGGAIYHWEPSDFDSASSSYQFTKLAGSVEGLATGDITHIQTGRTDVRSVGYSEDELMTVGDLGVCVASSGALQCLSGSMRAALDPEVAALYPLADDPAPLGSATVITGVPIQSSKPYYASERFCSLLSLVVSCSTSTAQSNSYNQIEVGGQYIYGAVYSRRPSQMEPMFTLPSGSSNPVVGIVEDWDTGFVCAIHDTFGFLCANSEIPDENGQAVGPDIDGDGVISLGREFSLECGVGFSCTFAPTKLRLSGSIITAVGTLTRSPRTSAAISGTVRFADGLPFQGSIEWSSSDGKLRATSEIAADGSFTLAARSGMGSIWLGQQWGELPATCLDGTVTAGCVTNSQTTIYIDSLVASNNVNIVVPSYSGEMRTIDLRFGDGETPISDVALNAVDPETECTETTISLGMMKSCASQGVGLNEGYTALLTGADGTISLWMPTAMDAILRISAADEYGLTWTEDIVSAGDDGATPEPYSFAGLIFAQPLGAMSVRQGSAGTVSALVSVDGIDPAYGMSSGIRPTSAGATTCSAERRTDSTDENGLVDFSLCPAGTQLWKVYATDGSFFPSAPFPVTIDPALTALRISGATLDTAFSGGTTTYTGRFTGSRVTFAPTKASWAGSARVTTPTCSRPSRGTRDCTMSVKVGSATITYTFTLRR